MAEWKEDHDIDWLNLFTSGASVPDDSGLFDSGLLLFFTTTSNRLV